VASLVLMDTSPGPVQVLPPGVLEAALRVAREQGMAALLEPMRRGAASDPRRPKAARRCEEAMGSERYWERIRRKLEAMDPEAFGSLGALLADHAPTTARLAGIACPTLVLVGAEDVPFLAPSRALAAAIPGARLEVIPDAAHSPQLENRGAWLAAVRAHLTSARDG
jgi:3-oxoadipate enol-lactonase/4-carboxymuconolactone decarboxylase